jgi:thioredoxin-like negative regulator of GroEL
MDRDEALKLHKAAREAYLRKEFSETLRLLDSIDAAFPKNKAVLYNRAQCLIALDRNDEARDLCDYLINTLHHAPAEELKRLIPD